MPTNSRSSCAAVDTGAGRAGARSKSIKLQSPSARAADACGWAVEGVDEMRTDGAAAAAGEGAAAWKGAGGPEMPALLKRGLIDNESTNRLAADWT